MPEEEGETAKSCIKNIEVEVTEADIDVAHRIGPPPSKARSRSIKVKMILLPESDNENFTQYVLSPCLGLDNGQTN